MQTRTHQCVERGVGLVHFAGDLRKQRHDDDDDGVSRTPLARPDLDGLVTFNRHQTTRNFQFAGKSSPGFFSVFFLGLRTVPKRRAKTTKGAYPRLISRRARAQSERSWHVRGTHFKRRSTQDCWSTEERRHSRQPKIARFNWVILLV